jgi:RHS repeat-associated protein
MGVGKPVPIAKLSGTMCHCMNLSLRERSPPQHSINDTGEVIEEKEQVDNLITWVFEDGSFVPCAKIENENEYSIIADYLGTPTHAYDSKGEKVWEREIDCYGKVRRLNGEKDFCPYLYQGQSVDIETGLAYNRFRYYDNESGSYLSQDPIGLDGNNPTFYGYIKNPNIWIDVLGLTGVFNPELAKIASSAHDTLRDASGGMTKSLANSTVSVAKVNVNGADQLFASGSGAYLRPSVVDKLVESGIPRENIFSGKAFHLDMGNKELTNLMNHAEKVIARNLPEGSVIKEWGISWASKQRNEMCPHCKDHFKSH